MNIIVDSRMTGDIFQSSTVLLVSLERSSFIKSALDVYSQRSTRFTSIRDSLTSCTLMIDVRSLKEQDPFFHEEKMRLSYVICQTLQSEQADEWRMSHTKPFIDSAGTVHLLMSYRQRATDSKSSRRQQIEPQTAVRAAVHARTQLTPPVQPDHLSTSVASGTMPHDNSLVSMQSETEASDEIICSSLPSSTSSDLVWPPNPDFSDI